MIQWWLVVIHIIESCVNSDLLPPGWSAAFKGGIPLQSVDWLSSDWKVTEGLIFTCAGRRDLSKFTRMSMIQRMNAAKNLCNVDPKILIKVSCSMTTHLLVLSSNPAILNSRSLRSADAFPVVASLPPKNSFRRKRSDDRKCVCASQAKTAVDPHRFPPFYGNRSGKGT